MSISKLLNKHAPFVGRIKCTTRIFIVATTAVLVPVWDGFYCVCV